MFFVPTGLIAWTKTSPTKRPHSSLIHTTYSSRCPPPWNLQAFAQRVNSQKTKPLVATDPKSPSVNKPLLTVLPTSTLEARYREMDSQLRSLSDPQQRFMACVERARQRPLLPDSLKSEHYRVEGCQVRIWFIQRLEDRRCRFLLDSDAVTLKAIAGLLCELYDNCTPEEVLSHPPKFLWELHLTQQLAENRRRTVDRIAESIQEFARLQVDSPLPSTPPTALLPPASAR